MSNIIDGKKIASEIKLEIKKSVEELLDNGGKRPHLAAVLVGNDGGSLTYVSHKVKACEEVGFESTLIHKEENVSEEELLAIVEGLNKDENITGFIVQLPLPKHISEQRIIDSISPDKDVDGFHPVNVGRMVIGLPTLVSATPLGIMTLLERYKVDTKGKNCVVLGRSNIVGRPISILLSQKGKHADGTVTVCHSRTKDIEDICRNADVIVAALGIPGFVKENMVKNGAVVIDVGTTRVDAPDTKRGWRLKGDVDYNEVAPKCQLITPVPGGVGPMTIVSLLQNTLKAYTVKEMSGK
ncbi:MAG: bifunctional 5,10-methylenetetrahydrofolate dehydrogenase/5,10-methenyltetrahydrofolate cyclohydrolase [Bacteroidales bacterium]